MTRVFVYGTLMRGGSNHAFLSGQRFVAAARAPAGYTLFALEGYPGMVRTAADRAGVRGELWTVDDACLRELDALEGVAEGLYERATIRLAEPPGVTADTYLYRRDVTGRPPLGDSWPG